MSIRLGSLGGFAWGGPGRDFRSTLVALGCVALIAAGPMVTACSGGSGGTTLGAGAPAQSTVAPATSSTSAAPAASSSTTDVTEPPEPATTSTASSTTSTEVLPAASASIDFDGARAMAHVKALADDIGIRHAGTDSEWAAVEYERGFLEDLGYVVSVKDVPIPNGLTSHNVVAVKPGVSPLTIVVGAHMDSWGPAPGANDNASGVGTVLELARDLKGEALVPTVIFVLFGNEEMIDDDPDHHHYGSRAYVANMAAQERADLAGMISLDMVAYGNTFCERTMGEGPQALRTLIKTYAADAGVKIAYERDPAAAGWSDHEPFERAGFPAVWLEWRLDQTHHTDADTVKHMNPKRLQATGDFVLAFLRDLQDNDLESLAASRTTP